MAPFSLLTGSISLLAKSFSVLSCTGSLARCPKILPAACLGPVKCLTSQASGPPKRPLNGYMRYVQQQKPTMTRNNPELKSVDVVREIAQQWRMLTPEQKQPFQVESERAREQFKVEFQYYQAQLTPAQVLQQSMERRAKLAKRKVIRKKREINSLGKPKRTRSAFCIFMSEHFDEASGTTLQAKMMSLLESWKSLLSNQKQVYNQLAEDDKIRYKNEMKSWEDQMVEIGREDLVRKQTLINNRRVAKVLAETRKEKAKPKMKAMSKGKAKIKKKTTKSSPAKTVRATKKT